MSPAIVAFPLLVSVRQGTEISAGCLALLIFLSTLGKHHAATRATAYLPFLSLCLSAAIVFTRLAPYGQVVFFAGAAVASFCAARRCSTQVAIRSLCDGVALYLLANIVGWLVGLKSPGQAVRTGLYDTSDSLFAERVFFPFSRSINEPPVVAAALFAYVVVTWRTDRASLTKIQRLGFFASIFVVAAAGSRAPAVIAVIVSALLVLIPILSRLVAIVSLSSMGLPFFVAGLGAGISYLANNLASIGFLSRGQDALELENFSSRGLFWADGIDYWQYVEGFNRVVGFGYNGHVTSKVVYTYYVEGGFVNSASALTLHNTLLQQLYDGGYIGVAALVLGLFFSGRMLASCYSRGIVAFFSVLMAAGALEVYMEMSFRATPAMLALLLSAVVAQTNLSPNSAVGAEGPEGADVVSSASSAPLA